MAFRVAARRLGAQWFSPLAHDVEVAGISEKAISSFSGNFFHYPDSHQVIERHCNRGNREFKRFGRIGNTRDGPPLHEFMDAQRRCGGTAEFLYLLSIFGK
jgi:hypothetical protein